VALLACGFQNIEHEIGAVKKCPGRFFRLPLARNGVPVTNRANRALQYHVARRVTPKPPAAVLTPGTTVRVVTFMRCDQKLMRNVTSITTAYGATGLVLCQASWQISDHELLRRQWPHLLPNATVRHSVAASCHQMPVPIIVGRPTLERFQIGGD
jgi:hypothetical protein